MPDLEHVATIAMWKCPACGAEMLASQDRNHLLTHAIEHVMLERSMRTTAEDERRAFIRDAAIHGLRRL